MPVKGLDNAGGRNPISNTLTVSKGFDRQLSPTEAQIFTVQLHILLAANILREYSVPFEKRYDMCFSSIEEVAQPKAIHLGTNHGGKRRAWICGERLNGPAGRAEVA